MVNIPGPNLVTDCVADAVDEAITPFFRGGLKRNGDCDDCVLRVTPTTVPCLPCAMGESRIGIPEDDLFPTILRAMSSSVVLILSSLLEILSSPELSIELICVEIISFAISSLQSTPII